LASNARNRFWCDWAVGVLYIVYVVQKVGLNHLADDHYLLVGPVIIGSVLMAPLMASLRLGAILQIVVQTFGLFVPLLMGGKVGLAQDVGSIIIIYCSLRLARVVGPSLMPLFNAIPGPNP